MSLYRDIKNIIAESIDEGEASAVSLLLLEKLAGMDRVHALMGEDSDMRSELIAKALRIAGGEPVQYVIGEADFRGLVFGVEPGVLVPRPETEELVQLVVDGSDDGISILDIGTGSGCIAVALAREIPCAEVEAWDISDDALRIAKRNGEANGVNVKFRKVDVLRVELTENVAHSFDVIVSNPPYICNSEAREMEHNVLDYEPHLALFVPDEDPLLFYRRIAEVGKSLLKNGGRLYFEINRAYGRETVDLLRSFGYSEVTLHKDQFDNERMVTAMLMQ